MRNSTIRISARLTSTIPASKTLLSDYLLEPVKRTWDCETFVEALPGFDNVARNCYALIGKIESELTSMASLLAERYLVEGSYGRVYLTTLTIEIRREPYPTIAYELPTVELISSDRERLMYYAELLVGRHVSAMDTSDLRQQILGHE